MTLRQQGPTRKLLVLAECRGQIVDQRFVEVRREPVQVTLNPPQETVGMIRVTAYEAHGPLLAPLAERLVYRTPAQRLDLGFTLNAMQLRPGPVSAKVTAVDEKGQPAAAWLLASFVPEYGGVGERFDWSLAPRNLARPLILSGGLDAGNVGDAIRRVRPWGVDVSSGVESAKGIKDAAKMAAFVTEVRNADV